MATRSAVEETSASGDAFASASRSASGAGRFARARYFACAAATLLFCGVFILYPLLRVLPAATLQNWQTVITSPRWQNAALNTLLLTILSTTVAVAVGFLYAYAVTRADIPFKKFFAIIPMVRLITPPFVGGLAFILLFGRQGLITSQILRLDVSLYGLPGLVLSQTFCFFPIAFMILRSTIENINPEQEQAAHSMGADRFYVFSTITLPLCLPGLISAALFIALSVLSDFGNPMLVGGRFRVLAVEIYTQLTGWVNTGTSAVIGIILLIPAMLLFFAHRFVSKNKREQVATVSGRGAHPLSRKSSLPIRIVLTVFCAVVAVLVIAHFVVLVWGAFTRIWGVDTTFTTSHISKLSRYSREIANSLVFSFCAAIIVPLLAALCAFLATRTTLRFRHAIDILATLPTAVPDPLIGLAYVLAFNGALKLTGTRTIIVLSMIVLYLPISYRIMNTAFSQIKLTIDDSAVSLGSSRLQTFFNILLPLTFRNLNAAFTYSFIRATGTMGAVIFLISFKTQVASVAILNLAEQGSWGVASVLAVALSIATFAIIGVVNLIFAICKKQLTQIKM